jgi:hypothetical protein
VLNQVHDKKKYVIPNSFRSLEFGNGKELIGGKDFRKGGLE